MRLIGVHGVARSGKDEFCGILCNSYNFKKLAFADKIRELAIKYFKVDPENVSDNKTKESRAILQGIGACVRNEINQVTAEYQALVDFPDAKNISDRGYNHFVEDQAIHYFGLTEKDLSGRKKYTKSVLNGLQKMWKECHTEFVTVSKGIPNNIWVNYIFKTPKEDGVYVISDVRYRNEKEIIHKLEGKVIKINRVNNPEIEAGKDHESEKDLSNEAYWNFVVTNEHKTDWHEKLHLQGLNMVRKFDGENFFNKDDRLNFKINI